MSVTTSSYDVSYHAVHGEVHFKIAGLWQEDAMQTFFDKINEAALPLMKARRPIHALGDMTEFVPQNRVVGEAIRDHLMGAQKFGLRRIAIITDSALVRLQYKRLSAGIEVDYFENQVDAIAWLRKPFPAEPSA
ncbi:MAG: STAS/SEC14 domain-containing protein [Erythrobacter sp.]